MERRLESVASLARFLAQDGVSRVNICNLSKIYEDTTEQLGCRVAVDSCTRRKCYMRGVKTLALQRMRQSVSVGKQQSYSCGFDVFASTC